MQLAFWERGYYNMDLSKIEQTLWPSFMQLEKGWNVSPKKKACRALTANTKIRNHRLKRWMRRTECNTIHKKLQYTNEVHVESKLDQLALSPTCCCMCPRTW